MMSRSKWKGSYVNIGFVEKQKVSMISRNSDIIPSFLGLTFNVYNGKSYVEVTVLNEMIGHKFGEFSYTRSKFEFKKKNKKK